MATAAQKIILSSSRDIPFNKLVLSQANVRRVKAGVSIEELAEDIARRTLLQGMNVRPVLDADGAETGMFEIPAGGRRYRALELLVKQKRLAKTAPVPCVVRDPTSDILAEDDSLAENVQRAPLHPLDQFRAFQAMRAKGKSEEDIAAAFFIGVNVVKQRLRLTSVSEKLLDIYAEDGMSLEQLMAFTVSSDHARQEQVWAALEKSWSKEPYQIRRMLTEKAVRAADRRAAFVGLDAYEVAGGIVMRDLFQHDDGGWLENVALLDSLVVEKLKAAAEAVAAEGWKWVEVSVSFPFGHTNGLRELVGVSTELTDDEQATIDSLEAEHESLETEYEKVDELPEDVDRRLGEIETALAELQNRPRSFDSADVARAGAFVSIDAEGLLSIDRGYVRHEDEAPAHEENTNEDAGTVELSPAIAPAVPQAVITIEGRPVDSEEDETDTLAPLPERLMIELTAHRTLALQNAVANNPRVAMTALLHKLVADSFHYASISTSGLEISLRQIAFPIQSTELKNSASSQAIAERQDAWKSSIPRDDQELWDWLVGLDEAHRIALLAHCISHGVNALHEKTDRYGGGAVTAHSVQQRLKNADRLARAVGLNMVDSGWKPTVDNYLGRVPKRRILDAVREGKGERAVQLIEHLKKGEMAVEAERLLADSGWLPEPLRLDDGVQAELSAGDATDESEELPEFLSDDEAAESADSDCG
jgi:ParB family chromosome partitioning protein